MALNRPSPFLEDTGEDAPQLGQGFEVFAPGSREYKRDLRQRNGGLRIDRKADHAEINATAQNILNGSFTEDQALAKIHRNPGAAEFFRAALQRRQQQQEIIARATQTQHQPTTVGGIPEFGIGKLGGIGNVLGNVNAEFSDESQRDFLPQDVEMSRGQLDPAAAQHESLKAGRFDLAKQFGSVIPKQSESRKTKTIQTFNERTGENQTVLVDAQTGDPITAWKSAKSPMSEKASDRLFNSGETYRTMVNLSNSFKPGYGGFKSKKIGELNIEAKKRFSNTKDAIAAVQWWQTFKKREIEIRKQLFGSALTATEKASWEKITIHPGMTDAQIQGALSRRKQIELRALRKLTKRALANPRGSRAEVKGILGDTFNDVMRGPRKTPRRTQRKGPSTQAPVSSKSFKVINGRRNLN